MTNFLVLAESFVPVGAEQTGNKIRERREPNGYIYATIHSSNSSSHLPQLTLRQYSEEYMEILGNFFDPIKQI